MHTGKQNMTPVVAETKPQVWEDFGVTMTGKPSCSSIYHRDGCLYCMPSISFEDICEALTGINHRVSLLSSIYIVDLSYFDHWSSAGESCCHGQADQLHHDQLSLSPGWIIVGSRPRQMRHLGLIKTISI